jgi:hypothetical protein
MCMFATISQVVQPKERISYTNITRCTRAILARNSQKAHLCYSKYIHRRRLTRSKLYISVLFIAPAVLLRARRRALHARLLLLLAEVPLHLQGEVCIQRGVRGRPVGLASQVHAASRGPTSQHGVQARARYAVFTCRANKCIYMELS